MQTFTFISDHSAQILLFPFSIKLNHNKKKEMYQGSFKHFESETKHFLNGVQNSNQTLKIDKKLIGKSWVIHLANFSLFWIWTPSF